MFTFRSLYMSLIDFLDFYCSLVNTVDLRFYRFQFKIYLKKGCRLFCRIISNNPINQSFFQDVLDVIRIYVDMRCRRYEM